MTKTSLGLAAAHASNCRYKRVNERVGFYRYMSGSLISVDNAVAQDYELELVKKLSKEEVYMAIRNVLEGPMKTSVACAHASNICNNLFNET